MFEVVVDNVGTVYRGGNEEAARKLFEDYKKYVDGEERLWPSECVTLIGGNDILDEYKGSCHVDSSIVEENS